MMLFILMMFIWMFRSVEQLAVALAEQLEVFGCRVLFLQLLGIFVGTLVSARHPECVDDQALSNYPQHAVLWLK